MFLSTLLIIAASVTALMARRSLKLFLAVFLVSCLYYSVLGPLYWLKYKDGEFTGIDWSASIPEAATIVGLGCILVTIFCVVLGSMTNFRRKAGNVDVVSWLLPTFLAFSAFAVLFVIGTNSNRNAAFLIAYQFSDMAIPTLVFLFASQKRPGPAIIGLIVFFVWFTLFVGFRYKLILLVVPIFYVASLSMRPVTKVIYVAVSVPLTIALLAIMTVIRVKFGGPNLNAIGDQDSETLLYSLFAESNTIFGMCSIVDVYLTPHRYEYFTPVTDTLLELVPRFILPDRVTGERIFVVLDGLISKQGQTSATTYPFVGEMVIMGGYTGLVLGCLAAAMVIVYLHVLMARYSTSNRIYAGGCGLIAVTFGYYFVSRGYMPQFVKSVIFVVFPYIFLIATSKKSTSGNRQPAG